MVKVLLSTQTGYSGYSSRSVRVTAMKADMGGAATITGGLGLAIGRGKLFKRIKLILCCAENTGLWPCIEAAISSRTRTVEDG
ncbi:hypothetical protein OK016_12750 [Vibrio chagasii]|nr:hypothetical protein [Vibrio chagasii]